MRGGSSANITHIIENFGIPGIMVEVGVYEGVNAFSLVDAIVPARSDFKLYAIDPHVGSIDMKEDPEMIYNNFMYNFNQCVHNKNVEYIRKPSEDALIDLYNRSISPEFIYIDGDHRATTVLSDLVLSFKILQVGGVILCDDATDWRYTDKNGTSSVQMSPRLAIETFIACYWDRIKIVPLPQYNQTAFKKLC